MVKQFSMDTSNKKEKQRNDAREKCIVYDRKDEKGKETIKNKR